MLSADVLEKDQFKCIVKDEYWGVAIVRLVGAVKEEEELLGAFSSNPSKKKNRAWSIAVAECEITLYIVKYHSDAERRQEGKKKEKEEGNEGKQPGEKGDRRIESSTKQTFEVKVFH